VNIPSDFDVMTAIFPAGCEPEAGQATLGPCERGPEPELGTGL
jgi:hypothetical protein